jgi:hypothetical protein
MLRKDMYLLVVSAKDRWPCPWFEDFLSGAFIHTSILAPYPALYPIFQDQELTMRKFLVGHIPNLFAHGSFSPEIPKLTSREAVCWGDKLKLRNE